MMKQKLFLLTLFLSANILFAQDVYKSTNSNIVFDAGKSVLETIQAENTMSKIIYRSTDNVIVALIPMKSFEFPNKLMQEHFNENYVHSDKYSNATFKGKIENMTTDSIYETPQKCNAVGVFKLHGVTKNINIPITIQKDKENIILIKGQFNINPEDYNIDIPKIMFYKIAEDVLVKIDVKLSI